MAMITENQVCLSESWKTRLLSEFQQPYMQDLKAFLVQEIKLKKCIYPRPEEYFSAFDAVAFEDVKVVILGQDPYHGPRQAHGLCFSVRPSVPAPPSLVNIFKELQSDIGIVKPPHGCLNYWAKQGVLLLNSTLTVEAGKAGSHQNKGWEFFTDKVIHLLNEEREHLVFMLWGSFAQKKGYFINQEKHLVLKAPHPSPFSADRGFFGCAHFSKANTYLKEHGKEVIDWSLPN
ncbi:MAG: uracil-DNA glycosylase [Bdellovibrionales bacterium]|nr:uracil-DNA glycosylase [Bdellovibrionales bacterium]